MEEKGRRSERRVKSVMVVEENVQAEASQVSEHVEDVEENLDEPEEEPDEPEEPDEDVLVPVDEEVQEEEVAEEHKEEEEEDDGETQDVQEDEEVQEEKSDEHEENVQEDESVQEVGEIEALSDEAEEQEKDHEQEAVEVSDVEMQDESAQDEQEADVAREEEVVVVTDENAPEEDVLSEEDDEEQETLTQAKDSDQPPEENEIADESVENMKPKVTAQQAQGIMPVVMSSVQKEPYEKQSKESITPETEPEPKTKSKAKEPKEQEQRKNKDPKEQEQRKSKEPKEHEQRKSKVVNKVQENVQKGKGKGKVKDGLQEGSTTGAPEASDGSAIKVSILYSQSDGRILFLEAGKEFVDLLMNFLLLPIGGIMKLLRDNKSDVELGALVRLFQSVERMERPIMLVDKEALWSSHSSKETHQPFPPHLPNGYVKDSLIFTITDELDVFPSSTIKSIALLNKLEVKDMTDLKSFEVKVDTSKDVLRLLKASLTSKSVLNKVFRSRLPMYSQQDEDEWCERCENCECNKPI